MLIVFILVYIFYWLVDQSYKRVRYAILSISCIILILCTGLRSFRWNDTAVYAQSFLYYTNNIFNYSFSDTANGYTEKGFYFLSSIIKTFTSDCTIYFLIISFITFYFIKKSLRCYCIYPLIGLSVYIARFMLGRNMMQIRAALSIAIVVYALQYINKKKLYRFLFFAIISILIHTSMIIALPLYWINKIKITKYTILYCIIGAFLCTTIFSSFLVNKVTELSVIYDIATSYTNENSEFTIGLGIYNPMIYYQTIILLIFTYYDKNISHVLPYYTIIRNGYFYSTIILILFSSFSALSGRTSTIYATFEIFIIPSLILIFPPKYRFIGFIGTGGIVSIFFYLNYSTAISNF